MTRGTDVTEMKRIYRTAVAADFPDHFTFQFTKTGDLRYGENPNQPGAVYTLQGTSLAQLTNIHLAKTGKGGLSATNLMDVTHALTILKYFSEPAVAVMKHLIPSGFATASPAEKSLRGLYYNARNADARSAYGSVVVFNRPVDIPTALELLTTYVEGVAAPEYEEGVVAILKQKPDLRVVLFGNLDKIPKFVGDDVGGIYDIKILADGSAIIQQPYLTSIRGVSDLIIDPLVKKDGKEHFVARDPTLSELSDLLTAWYINFGVRSNGIVIVKDGVTLSIGTGQQERVGAVENAILKAYQKALDRASISCHHSLFNWIGFARTQNLFPLKGAAVSSDAFFPFRDSIDLLAEHGVTAVVQPGGSVRDSEVIDAVNEHKMAMAFTLERCFAHF